MGHERVPTAQGKIMNTIWLRGDHYRRNAQEMVANAPDGWWVMIGPPARTLSQNKKMHAMLRDIADAKPEGRDMQPEDWKAVFMDALGLKPRYVTNLEGNGIVHLGWRSSLMSKEQMGDMISLMSAYGDQNGVIWSEKYV